MFWIIVSIQLCKYQDPADFDFYYSKARFNVDIVAAGNLQYTDIQ